MNEWINVSDRLPETGQEVLVYAVGKIDGFFGEHTIQICRRFVEHILPSSPGREVWSSPFQYFHTDYEITHWMPLPGEPPDGRMLSFAIARAIRRKNTISNLETQIRWIEDIECHQFPGWGNTVMAMRDAAELLKNNEEHNDETDKLKAEIERLNDLLKEQAEKKRKWLMTIADNQLANSPNDCDSDLWHSRKRGIWEGLQIAYEILTESQNN